jgi:hypothetical protein
MKKIFSFLILLFLLAWLPSCGKSINMGMLTEYQNGDFCTELKIRSGSTQYRAELTKKGEKLFLHVKEQALEGFTFVFSDEGNAIVLEETEIPLAEGELFRLAEIHSLFNISVAGTWKIEKASPGGVHIYLCENESVTMYIDANSHLPLKITSDKMEIDVLSFSLG